MDELPEENDAFMALVAQAEKISKEWNFIIIAGLSGEHCAAPTTVDDSPYLNQMVNRLTMGEDLSGSIRGKKGSSRVMGDLERLISSRLSPVGELFWQEPL